jgi:hypothetical protein
MFFTITPEQLKAQEEAQRRSLEREATEAKRKADARAAWEKTHPPCPHCGRRDPPPLFLDF